MTQQTIPTANHADLIARLFEGASKMINDPRMPSVGKHPKEIFHLMRLYMPVDEVESIGAALQDDNSVMFHVDNIDFELTWSLDLPVADVLAA